MQSTAINQPLFSLTLAGAFIFGVIFAGVVRWASKRKVVAQTAWAVTIGVAVTLAIMIPVFGLNAVAIMFCYFAASGAPMIFEYLQRVMQEIQQDHENTKSLASELLNERQTNHRS